VIFRAFDDWELPAREGKAFAVFHGLAAFSFDFSFLFNFPPASLSPCRTSRSDSGFCGASFIISNSERSRTVSRACDGLRLYDLNSLSFY